ncbi:hypothetical protein BKA63DRAFT_597947 [Paraphoma chrysanthemicola]|nr:hypothetical protein BKA63DRAFT_597947 [Paraphoma chrysanthemicola]
MFTTRHTNIQSCLLKFIYLASISSASLRPITYTMSFAPAPLVYINAFPGTGKLTIARALVALFFNSHSTATLIDNHTLIDPVAAKFPRQHPRYTDARRQEREKVLRAYIENPERDEEVVIITDCRATTPAGIAIVQEFKASAQRAGRMFVPVCLVCEEGENMRRLTSEERKDGGTTKLMDVEAAGQIRNNHQIYHFGLREELVLDVTSLSPEEAAGNIMEKAKVFIEADHDGEEGEIIKKP